jgi:hypothetical protein
MPRKPLRPNNPGNPGNPDNPNNPNNPDNPIPSKDLDPETRLIGIQIGKIQT